MTTSVFEKQASPLLKKFRVYGAWIKLNPDQAGADWRQWEEKLSWASTPPISSF